MAFLIANGKIISEEEASLTSFLFDNPFVFSQKVWFGHGGIPLLNENVACFSEQLQLFGAELPELLKNQRELFRLCKRMLNKNRHYRSGHILFQFFIYEDKVNCVISSENYEFFNFPFSEQGQLVDISSFRKESKSTLNRYAFHNQSLWEVAKAHIKTSIFQNSIFINENGNVCDGIHANIFMVKDGVLITPALETGCYMDVLRKIILEEACNLQVKNFESSKIVKSQLFDADELFLASETKGIEWILGIENKRFVHSVSAVLYEKVNYRLKNITQNS